MHFSIHPTANAVQFIHHRSPYPQVLTPLAAPYRAILFRRLAWMLLARATLISRLAVWTMAHNDTTPFAWSAGLIDIVAAAIICKANRYSHPAVLF